jgi:acyl-CoA thioester hydrolase
VNNVVYYSWFDTAANGWLIDRCAVDIRQLPAIGVAAETSCRFLRQTSSPIN